MHVEARTVSAFACTLLFIWKVVLIEWLKAISSYANRESRRLTW